MKNLQEKLAILNIWSRNVTTSTRETTTRAWIHDVRMAQFVLKIKKLSHIMGPRASQDLRSPSPIMAPALTWEIVLLRLKAGSAREWIFMISKFWRTALRHPEAKSIYCLLHTFFYTALKHFGILSFWQELYTPIPELSILPALYILVARVSSALFTSNQKVVSK